MTSFEVYYRVQYKCRIDIDAPKGVIDREGLTAAISDIEIPSGGYERSEYVDNSFEVVSTRKIINESPRSQERI